MANLVLASRFSRKIYVVEDPYSNKFKCGWLEDYKSSETTNKKEVTLAEVKEKYSKGISFRPLYRMYDDKLYKDFEFGTKNNSEPKNMWFPAKNIELKMLKREINKSWDGGEKITIDINEKIAYFEILTIYAFTDQGHNYNIKNVTSYEIAIEFDDNYIKSKRLDVIDNFRLNDYKISIDNENKMIKIIKYNGKTLHLFHRHEMSGTEWFDNLPDYDEICETSLESLSINFLMKNNFNEEDSKEIIKKINNSISQYKETLEYNKKVYAEKDKLNKFINEKIKEKLIINKEVI